MTTVFVGKKFTRCFLCREDKYLTNYFHSKMLVGGKAPICKECFEECSSNSVESKEQLPLAIFEILDDCTENKPIYKQVHNSNLPLHDYKK